jgi:transposase
MTYFAGIDVSLEASSICVVDADGEIIREVKIASEPEALVKFFQEAGFAVRRIGLEAGPLSQWLHDGLTQAGFDVVLLETRHVKAALSGAETVAIEADGRGAQHSGHSARLRAEDGQDKQGQVRGPGSRVGGRP